VKKGLVSIVVPVYNVEKYLGRCIDSLLNQTYENKEIILVDDGSIDSSGRICDEYADKYTEVSVIHQSNQGLGPARNTGLDVMNGEYVSFVDSDDWIEQDTLYRMISALKDNCCEVATCGRSIVTDTGIISRYFCSDNECVIDRHETIRRFLTQDGLNMSACDKIFKAELFDDVRFPGKHLVSEDIIPIYSVLKKTSKVVMTGEPFYNYYVREGSLSRTTFNNKMLGAYEYSRQIVEYIKDDFPDLIDEAKSFNYDFLITIYRYIRRSKYHGVEEMQIFTQIKKSSVDIFRNNSLTKKHKIYTLLVLIKCDLIPDYCYRRMKGKKRLKLSY
jgi:glycosyltransferase involved in cell wall biosynthesis